MSEQQETPTALLTRMRQKAATVERKMYARYALVTPADLVRLCDGYEQGIKPGNWQQQLDDVMRRMGDDLAAEGWRAKTAEDALAEARGDVERIKATCIELTMKRNEVRRDWAKTRVLAKAAVALAAECLDYLWLGNEDSSTPPDPPVAKIRSFLATDATKQVLRLHAAEQRVIASAVAFTGGPSELSKAQLSALRKAVDAYGAALAAQQETHNEPAGASTDEC